MAKFKIGDPVRCVEGDVYVQLGAEGVIIKINGETHGCYVKWSTLDKILDTDDNSWWIRPDQIELIEPEPAEPLRETIAPIAPDTARLARIERWAGCIIQGMLANSDEANSTWEGLPMHVFSIADAMEAEFQRRYNNNNNKD